MRFNKQVVPIVFLMLFIVINRYTCFAQPIKPIPQFFRSYLDPQIPLRSTERNPQSSSPKTKGRGEFYVRPKHVPTFPREDRRPKEKIAVDAKGIYMTGWIASVPSYRNHLISLIDRTELNTIVINVKDDEGILTGDDLGVTLARTIHASRNLVNLYEFVAQLNKHQIYPIARIVCFKDSVLVRHRPDLAVKTANGQPWRDYRGQVWVDPYNREVWQYMVDIAKGAAVLGFREIQFDYVRFVSDGNLRTAIYPSQDGFKKEDNIVNFLAYAKNELVSYNVFLSVDVFGLSATASDDMNIGQNFEKIASIVDYICPMTYPSHYAHGTFGYPNPNANPYEIVYRSMTDGLKKNPKAKIRPWLQDFSLGAPAYTATQVIAQKKAVYQAGIKEWLLWNASNRYHPDALEPASPMP